MLHLQSIRCIDKSVRDASRSFNFLHYLLFTNSQVGTKTKGNQQENRYLLINQTFAARLRMRDRSKCSLFNFIFHFIHSSPQTRQRQLFLLRFYAFCLIIFRIARCSQTEMHSTFSFIFLFSQCFH